MSKVLVSESNLYDIADSIRAKLGTQREYTPGQMSEAIDQISGGGVTVEPLSVTVNDVYTAPAGKAYSPVTVNVPGGGSTNILSGTSAPTAGQGSNGDVYLRTSKEALKSTTGQYVNTGYHGNNDSQYKIEFKLLSAQTSTYPTPFGARSAPGSVQNASYVHLGTNNYIAWGSSQYANQLNFSMNDLIGKDAILELKAGYCKLSFDGIDYDYTFSPTSISDTTSIAIFAALWNGVIDNTLCNDMVFYSMEIKENNSIVHKYVPKVDNNNIPCVYDEIEQTYLYNAGSGSFTYVESGKILNAYCKVSGAWQNLIGTDIDDVNTGGGFEPEFLYSFNASQGAAWINTGVDVTDIDALSFKNTQSGVVVQEVTRNKSQIAVYSGGADVYTTIYYGSNSNKMNARIYNNILWVSYNYLGAASEVTDVYTAEVI